MSEYLTGFTLEVDGGDIAAMQRLIKAVWREHDAIMREREEVMRGGEFGQVQRTYSLTPYKGKLSLRTEPIGGCNRAGCAHNGSCGCGAV